MKPSFYPLFNSIRYSLFTCVLMVGVCFTATAQILKKEHIEALKFRHIGPVGNRITCAVGVKGNDLIYYAGAATGGIWKTTDGGLNWKPVFDDKPVHSIGALAVAPSDPNVIYAGTGEPFIRSNVSIGNGVWKSTDGGATWNHLGLDNTGRISRILVHPTSPDIVYVGAVGHGYAPQKERGVHKSTDGGKTWKQVLYVDDNTGASDLVMDPSNPRILFAGMWQLSLRTWNRTSGGSGSGLHQSVDGGETWTKLKGNGLPEGPVGKIALSMTPADPDKVYALIETGDGVETLGEKPESGELWRSDDKGKNWKLISHDRNMTGRQAYYTRCAAAPDNSNEVYFVSATFYNSIDGGRTLEPVTNFASQPNWDHHDMWIDPMDGNRMIVAGDGGVSISKNRTRSWLRIQLPVAQLYHVTTDTKIPYNVITNRQDGPSMHGPSRSRIQSFFGTGTIPTGMWHDVGGGESGFATPDPKDPDVVWSSASGYGALGGVVTRYNEKTRQFRHVEVWPEITTGHPAAEVKYRFQWTFPLLISPHDHNTVYVTSQVVHRTTNGGQTWDVISPDLTLNDKSKQTKSGGLTPDNIGVEYANVIYAFDESPLKQGIFWVGTNDGQVQVSQDGGKSWSNVTKNIPEFPALGTVRNIEASKWAEGKAYITVEAHEVANFQPYVYRTDNFGKTWKKIVKGIEGGNLNYCRMVKEDPVRKGLLFLGTESRLYISFDDGENWQTFMSNLPTSPMYWMDIPEHFNDLVVGTYGRGIWILDDITPLQQIKDTNAKLTLFNPKDTYRFQGITSTMQFFPEASSGQDPPYGASLNYWSAGAMDSIKFHIINASGDTVRTIESKAKPGINRVWWDLQSNPTKKVVMRTPPEAADWFPLDKNRTRTNPNYGALTYLIPPGTYTVHLVAGGQSLNAPITILKDPHSEGTSEDIKAQTDFVVKVYQDLNTVTDMINGAESIRRQLMDLKDLLTVKGSKRMVKEVTAMEKKFSDVEGKLVQLKVTGTGQDAVRWPAMLGEKLNYLATTAATADFRPSDPHNEVYAKLKAELNAVQSAYGKLLKEELTSFTKLLQENDIGAIVIPK